MLTEYGNSTFPVLARREGGTFDLTPDPFSFTSESGVTRRSVATSNLVTVSGLSDGVTVPVRIEGGEYSLNGAPYTAGPGYAGNGDRIAVRHVADTGTNTTTLTIGGLGAPNSPVLLGTTASATFTNTSNGGGGALAPLALLLGLPFALRRPRRR